MNIVLLGADGKIGRIIADELLFRGHRVTGVTRGGDVASSDRSAMTVKAADVTSPDVVAGLVVGHDAVASAVGPRRGVDDDETILLGATRSLITALGKANVRRLVVLGGAGGWKSLRVFGWWTILAFPPYGRPTRWRKSKHSRSTVRWRT
jgi:putative NADH-flavin reductase